jgi:hypothetical protein
MCRRVKLCCVCCKDTKVGEYFFHCRDLYEKRQRCEHFIEIITKKHTKRKCDNCLKHGDNVCCELFVENQIFIQKEFIDCIPNVFK